MARKQPTPEVKQFIAEVRAGDVSALQTVERVIVQHGGDMQAAASALGVTRKTLYAWKGGIPDLGARISSVSRGRIGRPQKRTIVDPTHHVSSRSEFCTVYFLTDGTAIKIGTTTKLDVRFSAIQTANSREITLLATIRQIAPDDERKIHALLHEARLRGEWFNESHPLVRVAVEIAKNDVAPKFWLALHRSHLFEEALLSWYAGHRMTAGAAND